MIYPQNFEQKIGFDQIRSLIKEKCLSTLGIDYTDRMTFSTGYESIREQLNQTWEFVRILENADDFPADFFFDVRPSIKRVRIEGTFLEEAELFRPAEVARHHTTHYPIFISRRRGRNQIPLSI